MATLEKIRSKAGLLIFVLAFALLCFIVGDFLTNSTTLFNSERNIIGKIEGVKVEHQDFEEKVRSATEMNKYMGYGAASDDAAIRSNVWEEIKREILINEQLSKAGLQVTTAELTDATVGSHPHRALFQSGAFTNQQGQFMPSAVRRLVAEVNTDPNSIQDPQKRASFIEQQQRDIVIWQYLEKQVRGSLSNDKLASMVSGAISAPKAEVELLASLSKNERTALVSHKYFSDVPLENVKPSDDEVLKFYNENKDYRFKTVGYRNVSAVMFPISPSDDDVNEVREEMDTLRSQLAATNDLSQLKLLFECSSEKNYPFNNVYVKADRYDRDFAGIASTIAKGQVSNVVYDGSNFKMAKAIDVPQMRPDSARVSMIAIQDKDSIALISRADSILGAIRSGADFAEIAKKVSLDKASASNGGDQGWIQEGFVTLPDFDNRVFTSRVGATFSIRNGQVSFIVKVTDLTKPVLKAKLAILGKRVEASKTTIDSIERCANDFSLACKSVDEFNKAAAEKHYQVRAINSCKRNDPSTYAFPSSRCIVKWAWDHSVGSVSEPFTEIPGSYVVCVVTEAVDEGFLPADLVKDAIVSELANQKRGQNLLSEMAAAKSLDAFGTPDTAKAVRFSSDFVQNVGNEPAVAGAITNAKVGEVSKPVVGNSGVFIFQVLDEQQNQLPALDKNSVNQSVMRHLGSRLYESVVDKADVVDNRYNFF